MPAGVLQMHPKQLFGPMTIQWYRINNTERLEWALENGFTLQDAKFSMDTGMIVFPGLDDQNFIPKCVRGVTPPNPTETERALWEEFLTALENFSKPPPSWNYLHDLAIRWLTGACLVGNEQLKGAAADALTSYFEQFIPLHLAHLLMDKASTDPEWLKGKLKQGKITTSHVQQALRWAVEGGTFEAVEREFDILAVTDLCVKLPGHCKVKLAGLFELSSADHVHYIFRHLFGNDIEFQQTLANHLTELFGTYGDLDSARSLTRSQSGLTPPRWMGTRMTRRTRMMIAPSSGRGLMRT
jgi:hypothetical protein